MEKLLAIYDTDVSYALRFTEYIQKRKETGFEVATFTKADNLEDFLKDQPIEILLYCDRGPYEGIECDHIKYIFYLTTPEDTDIMQTCPRINKYQSAKSVVTDILSCYTRLENESNPVTKGSSNFLCVYSPCTGSTKMHFAWSMALVMADKKKTLFIPLDLFPVPGLYRAGTTNTSLSEFIYYLKEVNPKLTEKMKNLLNFTGKLSYLSGISHGLDLISLSKEDIHWWMEELREHTDYEAVVFYIGIYTEASIEIMKQSNMIYVVNEENTYEENVVTEWERQINLIDPYTNQLRYQKVSLPREEWMNKEDSNSHEIHLDLIWQIAEHHVNNR